jgi:uracil-xanthine permease
MQATKNNKVSLSIGVNEDISWQKSLMLGLQHVLAMDVYVPPFLIAVAVGMTGHASTALIQSTFLGAGIASLIQVLFFLKLPVCQGPSFVPVGAMAGIIVANGGRLDAAMGASLVGALAVTLLGMSGLYRYIVKNFVPPLVSGTIIVIVGLTLLPTAFTSNIFVANKALSMQQNVLLAVVTATVMILCSMLGVYFNNNGKLFRISSVIIALFVGSVIAYLMGGLDLSTVSQTSFLSLPNFAFINYGLSFNFSAIITMLVIYLVLLAETTGTWYAVSAVIEEPLDEKQVNQGVIGEGLGCLVASLIGATPLTGYSTNAGVISITGVASRKVFVGASFVFIGLAFLGKLSALINAIPMAVIGGVFAVVCVVIMLSGFRVIKNEPLTERQVYIIGVPLIFAVGLLFMPAALTKNAPELIQYLLASPIAVSAIVAIVMNKLLPEK